MSEMEVSPKGATSSKLNLRYDLVPPSFLRRVARRFALGIEKGHFEYNWRKGINDPDFIQARINHLFNHLNLFLEGKVKEDDKDEDNLAAIAWCIAMLMEFETKAIGRQTIQQVLRRMHEPDEVVLK